MHSPSTRKRNSQLRACLFLLLISFAAAVAGCDSGNRALNDVDPNAVAQNPTFDQVNAIIHNKCVMCHTATAAENGGRIQPLTSCTDIVAQRYDIINRTEDNTMPPGAMARLTSEERLIIERWVGNGAPAPCNPVP